MWRRDEVLEKYKEGQFLHTISQKPGNLFLEGRVEKQTSFPCWLVTLTAPYGSEIVNDKQEASTFYKNTSGTVHQISKD